MKLFIRIATTLPAMLIAANAEAHFQLVYPPSWVVESSLGDPQKDTPCGGEGGTPTGVVTRFRPGETINVQWTETIYHPGHWRIAFSENRADFVDPAVTVNSNNVSVSFTIDDPPVAPVLLDNLFPRTGNGSPMTFSQNVTLPNITCAHCTLQVLQMMVGHGPPNYIYFHCADIELAADPPDAGIADAGVDGGLMMGGRDAAEDATAGDDATAGEDAAPIDAGMMVAGDAASITDSAGSDTSTPNDMSTLGGGCGCDATDGATFSIFWIACVALIGSARRRARKEPIRNA